MAGEDIMEEACGIAIMRDYIKSVSEKLLKSDCGPLREIAELMLSAKKAGASFFTAGNGGSSSTASHLVNDLVKGCSVNGNPGFRAVCLADSSAVVTCMANDFSYEEVFSTQLKTLARPGDVLIVFSGSGNSPNIIKALEYAGKNRIPRIAFGGRNGGRMKEISDICMLAPSDCMEEIEDMHMVYKHGLVMWLRERLGELGN
jgi:D-sedoheptulose 7-phosphate isomerase